MYFWVSEISELTLIELSGPILAVACCEDTFQGVEWKEKIVKLFYVFLGFRNLDF